LEIEEAKATEVAEVDVVVIDRVLVRLGSVCVRGAGRAYHIGLAFPVVLNRVLSAVHG
jgi:hypothetical protein